MGQYLERGPSFIFLFHPALGPLWDVISQKLRGGALADRSEMVLEVQTLPSPPLPRLARDGAAFRHRLSAPLSHCTCTGRADARVHMIP